MPKYVIKRFPINLFKFNSYGIRDTNETLLKIFIGKSVNGRHIGKLFTAKTIHRIIIIYYRRKSQIYRETFNFVSTVIHAKLV